MYMYHFKWWAQYCLKKHAEEVENLILMKSAAIYTQQKVLQGFTAAVAAVGQNWSSNLQTSEPKFVQELTTIYTKMSAKMSKIDPKFWPKIMKICTKLVQN